MTIVRQARDVKCQNPGKEDVLLLLVGETPSKCHRSLLLLPWIKTKKSLSVAVIGDLILDEYLEGHVERISPEAPVPIHRVNKAFVRAGGAANSALNVQGVGVLAKIFGVVGNDEEAKKLKQIFTSQGVNVEGLVTNFNKHTIKKTRIVAANQQMLRVDWESPQEHDRQDQELLFEKLKAQTFDAILISDYGKGVLAKDLLEKIFKLAKERQVKVVVDPKGRDFARYVGCDLITPNKKEALLALDKTEEEGRSLAAEQIGIALQEKFGLKDVLLTMGAAGMMYVSAESKRGCHFRAPKAREVFDVSGAGDTVAALATVGLAAELELETIVDLANIAAGLVVEKFGTQAIGLDELTQAYVGEPDDLNTLIKNKVMNLKDLTEKIATYHSLDKKIVMTNGCFDILHTGHLTYLNQAKDLGDILVVAVNTDASVQKLKGPNRPINSADQRMFMLAGLACVDYVTFFAEDTPINVVEALKPNVLVKGGDYQAIDTIVGADFVLKKGGEVKILSFVEGKSTTAIINKVAHLNEP